MEHVTIYRKEGRYGGWPANNGIWSWDKEIVVGFNAGYLNTDEKGMHPIDRGKVRTYMQARSKDGGKTWEVSRAPHPDPGDEEVISCPGGIDFKHPDLAVKCLHAGTDAGKKSSFFYSYDRCLTWIGPFEIPTFGTPGVAARTDYLVANRDECFFFLTCSKESGKEGRPFVAKLVDGGAKWEFVTFIGDEPDGFAIMPSTVLIPSGLVLTAIRRREYPESGETNFIEMFGSEDKCETWSYMGKAVEETGRGGNPAAMIRLWDGRICMTYGRRYEPFGIRARISEDDGKTWGDEIVLRDDGGCEDLGYPRTVQRQDGTIVTTYYYNYDKSGERSIEATLWSAD